MTLLTIALLIAAIVEAGIMYILYLTLKEVLREEADVIELNKHTRYYESLGSEPAKKRGRPTGSKNRRAK